MQGSGHLENIVNTIADPIFVKDRKHRWVLLNDAFCQFMGYPREQLVGKSDYEYFPKKEADVFWDKDEVVFESGQENINEEELTDAGGVTHTIVTKKTLYTDERGEKFIVGIIRDVTKLKQLERQLLESQKMDALGKLAGGIAHDFNNIMTIISGYCENLAVRMGKDSDALQDLTEIQSASRRAVNLVKQLLAFSRREMLRPEVMALNHLIMETQKMIHRLVKENIQLQIALEPRLCHVRIDPGQMQQVIINMVINAQDAMPSGGKLKIETRLMPQLQSESPSGIPEIKDTMLLIIQDTGIGMSEEVRLRIFEPFFTTKGRDKGTGLGLATSYGIVKQAGGHIEVVSAPGKGSTFMIYLPVVNQEPLAASEKVLESRDHRGKATILLVEDESAIRKLTAKSLENMGYRVMAACDGLEALHLADTHPFDLLLSDVVMPNLGGFGLYEQLRLKMPALKVLFMTGYAEENFKTCPGNSLILQKPFSQQELARLVSESLASGATRAA